MQRPQDCISLIIMLLFRSMALASNALERLAFHHRTLETFLRRARNGQMRIRIPGQTELYRRKPRSMFHATPEIFFQTGGGTDFDCPGGSFRLGTGEVCVMPRGVPHRETPVNLKTPYSILVATFRPDGALLIIARSPGKGIIQGLSADHLAGHRTRDAFAYLDLIAQSSGVPESYQPEYIRAHMEAYLLSLLSDLVTPRQEPAPASALVREAANLARAHLADSALSVAGIAKSLQCSPDHLSRRFHAQSGKTLAAWIIQERLEMAQELLKTSRRTVSEIGWACGFNAPSYFIRVFKQHLGMTPRGFRQMHA